MDQLRAQVVFGEEFVVEARAPAVPGDLHSNPVYFCDTMEADVEEGRGRAEIRLLPRVRRGIMW